MAFSPPQNLLDEQPIHRINNLHTSPNINMFIEKSRKRKSMNSRLQKCKPKSQLSRTLDILYTVDIADLNMRNNTDISNNEESEDYFATHTYNVNIERRPPIQLPDGTIIQRAQTPQLQLDFEHAIVDTVNGDITFPAFCIIPKDDD